jgi:DNA-binding NtrC family response regulator
MARRLHFEVVPLSEIPSTSSDTGQRTVLVVDDEPLLADTLAMILSQAGFAARSVYNAQAALHAARESAPGFLLTDVQMPEMDGIELAMQVAEEFPACGILLFSGHATGADLEGARRAGYDFPLMEKPIHPAHLVSYITSCFDGKRSPGDGVELAEASSWATMRKRAS